MNLSSLEFQYMDSDKKMHNNYIKLLYYSK